MGSFVEIFSKVAHVVDVAAYGSRAKSPDLHNGYHFFSCVFFHNNTPPYKSFMI